MEIAEKRSFHGDFITVSEIACEHTHLLDISRHLSKSNISLFRRKLRQTELLDRQNRNDRHPDMIKK